MKSLYWLGSVGLTALFVAYGCAVTVKETPGTGSGGAGGSKKITTSVTGPGSTTSTGMGGNASGTGGSAPADESTSCANAVELAKQTNMQNGLVFYDGGGILAEAGDKDYFKFTAKAGDWILVLTDANPMDDPMMVDTVATLFSADGKNQLAEADDGYPRAGTPDSEFSYHVVTAGTYCLQIQEFSSWKKGATPKGDPSFKYRPIIVPLDAANLMALGGHDVDAGANDTTATAQLLKNTATLQNKQIADQIYGMLEPKTDKDVYKFTTPAATVGLGMDFEPSGTSGDGSTGGIGNVNILTADGATILGQLSYGDATATLDAQGNYGFSSVPLKPATTYLLEINRNAAEVGANDFYYFKMFTQDTLNPQEMNEAANFASTSAEATMATVDMKDPKITHRFIGGNLPAGDIDYWKLDATSGDLVSVACSSRRAGSGVEDFTVALFQDAAKPALQTEIEAKDKNITWSDAMEGTSKPAVKVTVTGTHYLKLSSTKMLTGGATTSFYLCGIHTKSP